MLDKIKQVFKIYYEPMMYLIFGGMSFLLNTFLYYWFAEKLQYSFFVSNMIAWISSVIFSFVTNKLFVFKKQLNTKVEWVRQGVQFVLARIFTGCMDMLGLYLLIDKVKVDQIFSKVFINIVVIVINYIISKVWIFVKMGG